MFTIVMSLSILALAVMTPLPSPELFQLSPVQKMLLPNLCPSCLW